tara:strand:+ start:918 stop:1052 length:135 start_codon:yes stop_codon:yes gene_type:complete
LDIIREAFAIKNNIHYAAYFEKIIEHSDWHPSVIKAKKQTIFFG